MKAGFVLIGGLVLLLYLASKKVTTQTGVTLGAPTAHEPEPAASALDNFLSTQALGSLPDPNEIARAAGHLIPNPWGFTIGDALLDAQLKAGQGYTLDPAAVSRFLGKLDDETAWATV